MGRRIGLSSPPRCPFDVSNSHGRGWYNIFVGVNEIESAIENLQPAELAQLEEWFARRQSDIWDEQLSQDIDAGKLNSLAEQAIADFKAGRCSPL